MKIIYVPFCFYPDPIGGTEVYVEALASHLQEQDVQVLISAPAECDAAYQHHGLRVRRFAVSPNIANLRELYGKGDNLAAQRFGQILDVESPDVVHVHAFTRGVSLALVRQAKQRGIPVVFTYHTPTVSCQRGTLMRWGRDVCDGTLDVHTCTRCTLHGLGGHRLLSVAVGSLPPIVGALLGISGLSGGFWTALRMTELVQLRQATFLALMAEVDHVVALCQWVQELLLRNGVPATNITVSRHGLPQPLGDEAMNGGEPGGRHGNPSAQHQLRMAFLGRVDPTKGPDLLIQALQALPGAPISLDLYGIVQSGVGDRYCQQLQESAAGDPRIQFLPPMPSAQVVGMLKNYHLLAVPSRWLETGPLVVLEAFAAGVPVLGSNLGGIAELVEHGRNGLLVEPDSPEARCQTFRRLVENPALLVQLRAGIRPPRRMQEVAQEMLALYTGLVKRRPPISTFT
jgi:glycosyltransferase involved in cell wall biosynthesis